LRVTEAAGYRRVAAHPALREWAEAARGPAARAVAASTDWRCGGTWCVGLDALPNAADGSVGGVPLPWAILGLAPVPLHAAQVSTTRAGYPQPSAGESDAAFRFRRDRDGAHLDGLIAEGPDKRRFIREPHGWILGLPLNEAGPDAAPLVVWEGSHEVMRTALARALAPHDPAAWGNVDITDTYAAARREVFDTCRRVELPGRVGEAVILHRLLIHGVAPWRDGAWAEDPGRMVAYFRPVLESVEEWLFHP
jgi:hypothetical protein